jgi:hypothetical protein
LNLPNDALQHQLDVICALHYTTPGEESSQSGRFDCTIGAPPSKEGKMTDKFDDIQKYGKEQIEAATGKEFGSCHGYRSRWDDGPFSAGNPLIKPNAARPQEIGRRLTYDKRERPLFFEGEFPASQHLLDLICATH